jgi:hypothetical protein
MMRFFTWFPRPPKTNPVPASRRRTVCPQLEQLEGRLVPSQSSAISIYHPMGQYSYTERDWFTVDKNTGHVVEFQGTTRYDLGTPWSGATITEVSASVDPNTGFGEVFAVVDSALWLCDSHGTWHLYDLGTVVEFSATHDGHVYDASWSVFHSVNGSIFQPQAVYYLANTTGANLGMPANLQAVTAIAAGVDDLGHNEVFVVGSDGAIYVNSANASWGWRLVDNSARFVSISATQNDTVFAISQDGKLYQETEHFHQFGRVFYPYWTNQDISGGRTYTSGKLSADSDASGRDEVYAIDSLNKAWLYDQGIWTWKDSDVKDISGAGGGYFYDVNQFSNLNPSWLYDPYASQHWTFLSYGLQ